MDSHADLAMLAKLYEQTLRHWTAVNNQIKAAQRNASAIPVQAMAMREELSERQATLKDALETQLTSHITWPFMRDLKGIGGVTMARIIGIIDDPRRFPGQACSSGHIFAPDYDVEAPCPLVDRDGNACGGTMQPPRPHTGVSSVRHYFGLITDEDGQLIQHRRGQRSSFHNVGRSILIGRWGVGDKIKQHKPNGYYDTFVELYERKCSEGKPAKHAEFIGKLVAVKELLGDFLMDWKSRLAEVSEHEPART